MSASPTHTITPSFDQVDNFFSELSLHVSGLSLSVEAMFAPSHRPIRRKVSWNVEFCYERLEGEKLGPCQVSMFLPCGLNSIGRQDNSYITNVVEHYTPMINEMEDALSLCLRLYQKNDITYSQTTGMFTFNGIGDKDKKAYQIQGHNFTDCVNKLIDLALTEEFFSIECVKDYPQFQPLLVERAVKRPSSNDLITQLRRMDLASHVAINNGLSGQKKKM